MITESPSGLVAVKDAVIFDLFHTLTSVVSTMSGGQWTADVLGVSREAWSEQLLEKSRERLTGEETDPGRIIRKMAHAIDPTIREETIDAAARGRIDMFARALINIPEETQQVLKRIKSQNKKIGLISNADVLEVAEWDRSPIAPLFDAVVFSCAVGCVKPEREIYEICMNRLGVTPGQCVFVGDGGSKELEGARKLGITTIMITGVIKKIWPDRIDERRRYADGVIEHLSELISNHG